MLQPVRKDRYDLVVVGGGPAGFACAVTAARAGLATALVEKAGCLGGNLTLVGLNHLLGGRKLQEETGRHLRVVGGIFDELTDRLIQAGDGIEPDTVDPAFNPFGWYPRMASGIAVDETALKIALDDLCAEAGVRVYFGTSLLDVQAEGGSVREMWVHNKDGVVALCAPLFADCTGDGDLAAMAGCPYSKGRDEDGLMTPATLEMHVDNVDTNALVRYQNENSSPKLVEIIERLKQAGEWPFPYEIFVGVRLLEEDVWLINTLRQVGVDGTKERDLSCALRQGRRENVQLFRLMQQHFPGFARARIRRVMDTVGVRETRRFHCAHTVTVADAQAGRRHPDTVAATTYNFDLPDPLRPSYDPMMGDAKKPNASRQHVVIRLPYRSLLPQGVDNLVLAGRCIGAEREVLGPLRITGPCMMMGQAAGMAAALAKQNGTGFAAVDTAALREALWAAGVLDPDTLPFT